MAISQNRLGQPGVPGPKGDQGDPGVGVPTGGTTGQVLRKASNANYATEWGSVNATPGGSVGHVQFHGAGGVFAGDSNYIWDNAKKALGIQVSSPQAAIHASSVVGQTIPDVSVASVSQVAEAIDPSPTGTITAIAEFPAPGPSDASQNFSGSGYTASGQSVDYQIYAVLFDGTTYYRSQFFNTAGITDANNNGDPFSVLVALPNAAVDQTHWLIEKQVNGGGYTESVLVPVGTSSYEDGNFGGTATTAAWPNYYSLTYSPPIAPSGMSASAIDVGSGGLFANGTNYNIEARSAANVAGMLYCEQTGDSTSYSDPNDSSQFNLETTYSPNGGDDTIFRISTDGGVTWSYFQAGTSGTFVYSGQSSESGAEEAWFRSIAAASKSWAFKCYGKTLAPGGFPVVYASSADTYLGTITTPNVGYIFKHSYSGFPSAGARVLGDYNAGLSNGRDVSTSEIYDAGYNLWTAGTDVSSQHYGFTGTSQNIEYRFYGFSSGLLIYSATALSRTSSDTGGYKYNSVSFTFPSGATSVKVVKYVNGSGTPLGARIFSSPTSSFEDTAFSSWSQPTTITPNAAVPPTSRYDNIRASETDPDCLQVVAIGSTGTRLPSIAWGTAASSDSSVNTLARVSVNSSTGYMSIGSGRVAGFTTAGMSQEAWRLGNSYDFNLNKNGSAHFTVWGTDLNHPMAYFYAVGDGGRGAIFFGQSALASTITSSKVVIAPTAGGTTGLHLRYNSGATASAILIDEAGSFRGVWAADGRMAVGTSTVLTNVQVSIGATTGRAQFRLADGGGASSPTAGDLWRSGGNILWRNASSQTLTLCGVLTATATLDFPSINAGATAELTMTVTGATVGDAVFMGAPSTFNAGLTISAFVSATNTVTVRVFNGTAGAINPASSVFRAVIARL